MIDRSPQWRRFTERSSARSRLIPECFVVVFAIERSLSGTVDPNARRRVYDVILKTPQVSAVRLNNLLVIDIRYERSRVRKSLSLLRKAERAIVHDPEIMGGQPVFRGTRVPVHAVVAMIEHGTEEAELLKGYPSLTKEKLDLARLYARAHPQRGRPPQRPWHVSRKRCFGDG
ncbi:MAG: DUF433 domain-containing protein [Proteobacteria bacterium]|nr:DUF433 domain-containing protein [Pseudomonadota bacterium]